MPLNYEVDTLDSIPETLREHYAAHGGKFRLDVDGLDDTTGLKRALQAERELNKAVKNEKTAAEIASALAKAAEPVPTDKSAEFQTLLRQREQVWQSEKAALQAERDAATASERTAIVDATLTAALTAARATGEGIDLLPRQLADRIKFEMVDGRRKITVMGPDGLTPMAGAGPNGAATVGDLVMQARNAYPSLFEGTGAGGSGTDPKGLRRVISKNITRSEFHALGVQERAEKMRGGFKVID